MHRSYQRHRHIRLRVPYVTLGAEKTLGRIARRDGNTPLEQLIQSAESKTNRNHKKIEPIAPIDDGIANQNFPRDDRRYEALGKVPELIVVVSLPAQESRITLNVSTCA